MYLNELKSLCVKAKIGLFWHFIIIKLSNFSGILQIKRSNCISIINELQCRSVKAKLGLLKNERHFNAIFEKLISGIISIKSKKT